VEAISQILRSYGIFEGEGPPQQFGWSSAINYNPNSNYIPYEVEDDDDDDADEDD